MLKGETYYRVTSTDPRVQEAIKAMEDVRKTKPVFTDYATAKGFAVDAATTISKPVVLEEVASGSIEPKCEIVMPPIDGASPDPQPSN